MQQGIDTAGTRAGDSAGMARAVGTAVRSKTVGLIALEHSHAAYRADFAMYGAAIVGLAVFLAVEAPHESWLTTVALTVLGLFCWSAIEYALHRFVLHGLQPFLGWHEAHHERPTALICAPTILSAALIVALVFLPALMLSDLWRACALTLGVMTGYLGYAMTHHATHHLRANSDWLQCRKRWRALHHRRTSPSSGHYGVTSAFWDHLFGSASTLAAAVSATRHDTSL